MDGTGPWEKFYIVWEVMELDIFSIQSFPYNSFKVIGRRNLFLQTRSKKKLFRNKMTFQTTARENWCLAFLRAESFK